MRALFISVREKTLQRWDRGTRILPHSIKTGLWFSPTQVAASVFGIPVENNIATRKVSAMAPPQSVLMVAGLLRRWWTVVRM